MPTHARARPDRVAATISRRGATRRALLLALLLGGLACRRRDAERQTSERRAPRAPAPADSEPVRLRVPGSTFAQPLYERWAAELPRRDGSPRIDYQPVGSGAGLDEMIADKAPLAAVDADLTAREIALLGERWGLLPVAAGAVAIAFHLPGVSSLSLSRKSYSGIFAGVVTHWDHESIVSDNPGVTLPNLPIEVVHRADEAGTAWVFTEHLWRVSPWQTKILPGRQPTWPTGIEAAGNEGVAHAIAATPGRVGYVQSSAARAENLAMAALENRAGRFVAPSPSSVAATLRQFELEKDFRLWVPDPIGDESYPITTYTLVVARPAYRDAKTASAVKAFLRFVLSDGQRSCVELGYMPLPEKLRARALDAAEQIGFDPNAGIATKELRVSADSWWTRIREGVLDEQKDRLREQRAQRVERKPGRWQR